MQIPEHYNGNRMTTQQMALLMHLKSIIENLDGEAAQDEVFGETLAKLGIFTKCTSYVVSDLQEYLQNGRLPDGSYETD